MSKTEINTAAKHNHGLQFDKQRIEAFILEYAKCYWRQGQDHGDSVLNVLLFVSLGQRNLAQIEMTYGSAKLNLDCEDYEILSRLCFSRTVPTPRVLKPHAVTL